jgi:alpha-beta hydrolase superfamily lysophospholipase
MANPIPVGPDERTLRVGTHKLRVFTYKPENYRGGPLLVVFHGMKRNADDYRDFAISIADRFGMVVAAPKFDLKTYPILRYQRGGIVDRAGLLPRSRWTTTASLALVDVLRGDEGKPGLDYYLLGHSAGGQIVGRLAAFSPNKARRIVVANPSSWVFPDGEVPFPHGFGGRTASLAVTAAIKRYLALPITVYLGTADIKRSMLENTRGARAQGRTRFERGRNFFKAGQALAKEKGWKFNWRLVTVPGIGHDGAGMFASSRIKQALF